MNRPRNPKLAEADRTDIVSLVQRATDAVDEGERQFRRARMLLGVIRQRVQPRQKTTEKGA